MSVFLQVPAERILYRDAFFFVIRDGYPVSPGHSLIISNHLRPDYFALTLEEQLHLPVVIAQAKCLIEQQYRPDGYNIGMNCGEVAGQTVPHFHCHLIPRYVGDMDNPRGGVRHCVAGKGYY
ncbi:HIT family protein [Hymenobacter actinosclerus]|uniref:Diadenosine tetraphosphate (Ap4A) hydrolase n=1 Tax=Hymenobacter actinosclerus TaxID=82805 RepID=A0A1I0IKZ0_9BACT|nr:HIT family protein [Hymenobacter actinosclerus]SET97736.1 Diadenosine tetraphosphate (Ap4A) hydrolase [Hymenobacter actinosclerus]